jgi:hypothetical protein
MPSRHGARYLVLTGLMAAPGSAFGDEVLDRCVDAHTLAQSFRREGRLNAASERLKICADASCPSLVRSDCTQLLDDLDRALPTIVFDAKDDAGGDLTEVKVQMDGRPFADRLDGIAIAADPGEHTFTFEAAGHSAATQRLVLREGEKGRRERIILASNSPATTRIAAAPGPVAPLQSPPVEIGAQRWLALVAGGVGVIGLGASATLALLAKSKSDDANAVCPNVVCPVPQAVNMNHDAIILGNTAMVVFVASAASVGAATVLWLTAKPTSRRPSAAVALGPSTLVVRGTW